MLKDIFRPGVRRLWLWLGLVLIGSGFGWQMENSTWQSFAGYGKEQNCLKQAHWDYLNNQMMIVAIKTCGVT